MTKIILFIIRDSHRDLVRNTIAEIVPDLQRPAKMASENFSVHLSTDFVIGLYHKKLEITFASFQKGTQID